MNIKPRRPEITGLTGIRCFAALSVVLGHAFHGVNGYQETAGLTGAIARLSGLGMTLFFVLSGFVIHYNYREIISAGRIEGYWKFFVARFARLYPLYLTFFVFDLFVSGYMERAWIGRLETIDKILYVAPMYLMMAQSWFYGIIGSNNYIYQFGPSSGISWSISTEWFFYVCYPLIGAAVAYLSSNLARILAVLVLSVFTLGFVLLVVFNLGLIDQFALSHYGIPASTHPSTQDSLFRWILYFSPYTRISEFFLGVLVCSLFLNSRSAHPEKEGGYGGLAASIAAIILICAVHFLVLDPARPWPILTSYHMLYGYAVPVGLLLYCTARYRNAIIWVFSLPPIVWLGEISYSIYLSHIVVVAYFQHLGWMNAPSGGTLEVWIHVLAATAATIAVSAVTYFVIEVPARVWLRRVLSNPEPNQTERPVVRTFASMTRGGVVMCLLAVPLAIAVLRIPPKVLPPPPGTVEIVEATYGGNCGAAGGNASKALVAECSGTQSCNYVVSVERLGDPAGGCGKDFSVRWRCSGTEPVQTASIPPEAGLGEKAVLFSCPNH